MRRALVLALVLAPLFAEACSGNEAPAFCADAWPPAPHAVALGAALPAGITLGEVKIDSYYEPCANESRLLILRATAAWCGPCRWHGEQSPRILGDPALSRVRLVDLVVGDEDNVPADGAALDRWRALVGANVPVVSDPTLTFGGALTAHAPLPHYVLVDTKTMRVRAALSDPSLESLVNRVAIELAELDRRPPPPIVRPPLHDGMFTESQRDMIRGMATVAPVPGPDPTNAFSTSKAAAAFGARLFADAELSPSATVACATCHDPARAFADGRPQAFGLAAGDRNTPSLLFVAGARWFDWDGRADTLWSQALGPLEDAREMAASRAYVAHRVASRWPAEYASAFPDHPIGDLSGVPRHGKPGDPAYDALDDATKGHVTRIFTNVGKAVAAFERTIRAQPSALDRYAAGDTSALSPEQKHALALFFVNGCAQCHWGPRLTDDAFHALRFPTGRRDGAPDFGRALGVPEDPLGARSSFSDGARQSGGRVAKIGTFKTPPLRGVRATAPYGHGGTLASLEDVMLLYGKRGLPPEDPAAVGETEPWVPAFDVAAAKEILPLFEALDVEYAAD